jgi:hypothetical protein
MKTEEFIATLASDLKPIPRGALYKRVLLAAAAGAAITFAAVVLGYELRPDLAAAAGQWDFWRKLAFTLAVSLLGLCAVFLASRPGANVTVRAVWLLAPFAIIAALGLVELASVQPPERLEIWLGETALVCPPSILVLSIPVLTALLLSMRRLAPTRPATAGLLAGLTSGGVAATMYALHCPEWAASFVATWYALGILLAGLLGAAVGVRVLRW